MGKEGRVRIKIFHLVEKLASGSGFYSEPGG